MQEKITKTMEYVCDELCRHSRETPDQGELDAMCAECKLKQLIDDILLPVSSPVKVY